MIERIKKLLGFGPKVDYADLVKRGAIIVDVRTKGEYSEGHIKGSVNIPLDRLTVDLKKLKDRNQPIITCCASGMRSSSAKSILRANGFTEVHNGGGWQSLNHKIR